jgi:hypothetical protein
MENKMGEVNKESSFIGEWLEQKKSEPEFDPLIIASIKKNLGGVNNESIDEAGLLKALIEIANRLGNNG